MADFVFSVLWILAFSALQVISLSWGEIKRLKETLSTIEELLQDDIEFEDVLLKDASNLRDEIECNVKLWNRGIAGRKLCLFFSSSNPLVFCFRIGPRIKKLKQRIDLVCRKRCRRLRFQSACVQYYSPPPPYSVLAFTRASLTNSFSRAKAFISKLIDEDPAKLIAYVVACIFSVCMDPFFLYIPFLNHTKMCLGMNKTLWIVSSTWRSVADFLTILILIIDRPQLSWCMSSIKSISLMCVKVLALVPIPQILLSKKFILITLRGYKFWNLSTFCQCGTRLVLIFQACEQLKMMVSVRTLVLFNTLVYLLFYCIVSHVIGASWYFLSIRRQLSCWNSACEIDTGCIFHCDGTTTSTMNSTLYNQFCPIDPPSAAVFDYGIYLDALQSRIVEEEGVLKKFLRCFFWGLRNLSSYASNLHTSTNDGETSFAIIISVVALILFTYIIGNIQRYSELGSARLEMIADKMKPIKELIECLHVFHRLDNCTKKLILKHIRKAFANRYRSFNLEELRNCFLDDVTKTESVLEDLRYLEEWVNNGQRDNRRKAKKWLSDNKINQYRNNILFYLRCRLKDEDVNLESVISVIPDEYKWKTMKDLCFDTLKKVPGLQDIDEEWFKSISSKLEPVIYPKGREIFLQGRPLDFIIFITNGDATSYTSSPNAGGVSVSTKSIKKGDFFGGELIQWKLDGISESESAAMPSTPIPTCTADVKSDTQVEAFVLTTKVLLSSEFPVKSGSADSATQGIASSSCLEESYYSAGEIEEME